MNKKAFVVLVVSMLVSMLGMGIVSPFLPIYANTLGASSMEVGLIQAAFSISGIGTLLFVGRLSDRFGRRPFLSTGMAIFVISSVGMMFANDPVHLILWRFIQGLGSSLHLPIAQAYLGDITPEGNEGKWMGTFNSVLYAGIGAGPLVGGVIKDAFSIKASFMFMAVLNALSLVSILVFLKEMPRKIVQRENISFVAPLRSRIMRGVLSYNMTTGMGTASVMAFMPLFADVRLGLKASLIGIVLAARSPVAVLQSYTGRLADRCNRRSMVICGGLTSILAISLLPMAGGFWPLLAAYLCITVGQAFGVPAANAYVVQEGRTYGMGASMTMFMLAMHVGTGIGPVVLGAIADRLGLDSVFYTASICMISGLLIFSLLLRGVSPVPQPAEVPAQSD